MTALRGRSDATATPALSAILFDWDGTLADTAEASFRSYVRLFGSFGIRFDRELFQASYSPDWYRTHAFVGLPRERWGEADSLWLVLYEAEQARLLPGAADALRRLKEAGLALAVVTSGSRARVTRELARFGLEDTFAALVCSEDAARRKPDPEPLSVGLARLGVAAGQAACVGDSSEDVEMARAAGVFSVGVPGGFPNHEALRSARPDLLAAGLPEAAGALIERSRARREGS
jgi:HAD superfamily hydrolase (TIGR01509 family)